MARTPDDAPRLWLPPSSRNLIVSRRNMLQGIGAAIGAATVGCGGAGDDPGFKDGPGGGVINPGSTGAGSNGSDSNGSGSTGSGSVPDMCSGNGGLTPEELLAPIDTIVILCMENRSFDHYLGALSLEEKRAVDGLTGAEWNPDPKGIKVPVFHMTNLAVESPPHDWDPVHQQWNMGKNDQFVIASAGPHQQEVMGYYTRTEIPTYYALSDAYTVCDRYFCSLLGPTWPNRFFLHGASSHGVTTNVPVVGFTSIFDQLDGAGVESRNYYGDVPWCTGAYGRLKGLSGIETFFEHAAAGTLPKVSIIDPTFFGQGANDDHPDHDVKLGEALIASVYAALAASPQWGRCLFVLTYDEHGGFFDHVPPPPTVDGDPAFAQLGFRVPTIVAGPFARKGCVVSTQLEHVSILRTLARRFKLPSLNARVDATEDLSSCIDPKFLDNPQAATKLPRVRVPLKKVRASRPAGISQPEMWAAAESGRIPWQLDRRAHSLAIAERILAHGERLGAIEIV